MSELDDKTRAEAEAAQRLLEKRRREMPAIIPPSLADLAETMSYPFALVRPEKK